MTHIVDTDKFIKSHLRYTTVKRYVGDITAGAIYNLRCVINQTENDGCGFLFHCGRITSDMLLYAFRRQMAYNPLRFTEDSNSEPAVGISKNIQNIIMWFNQLWPNGTADSIRIMDISDPKFRFLINMRDCFKAIALLNMSDFKRKEYRDEIVAYFADANIAMTPQMRSALRTLADKSADERARLREIRELQRCLSAIETEMNLHRSHDRSFFIEMQDQADVLKARLEQLHAKKRVVRKKTVTAPAKIDLPREGGGVQNKPAPVASPVSDDDGGALDSDGFEREEELLRTMTPEHVTDEVFREYAEQVAGVRLHRFGDYQH